MNLGDKSCAKCCFAKLIKLIINEAIENAALSNTTVTNDNDFYLW